MFKEFFFGHHFSNTVYEELQADINNVIANKANDLIASIKE